VNRTDETLMWGGLDCKESGESYCKHCKKAEQQMFEMASTRQKIIIEDNTSMRFCSSIFTYLSG
jgi:hypothetical protein